jgi:hypothetical protein
MNFDALHGVIFQITTTATFCNDVPAHSLSTTATSIFQNSGVAISYSRTTLFEEIVSPALLIMYSYDCQTEDEMRAHGEVR